MRRSTTTITRSAVVVIGLALLAAACSTTNNAGPSESSAPPDSSTSSTVRQEAPKRIPLAKLLDIAFADIEDFWTAEFPSVYGGDYEPVTGGFIPYSSTNPPPPCGGFEMEYEPNAFYCYPDDTVMWDEEQLIPDLYDKYGQFTVAFVFAHEWGHAIELRSGLKSYDPPSVVLELQADCFAGAWARHLMDEGDELTITVNDLPLMVAGALEFADPVGMEAAEQGAHGSGFDRIGAMELGFNQGAERCAGFADMDLMAEGEFDAALADFPEVFEIPFTDEADFLNEGNAPYDDILPVVVADLDQYWDDVAGAVEFDDWQAMDLPVGYAGTEGKYPKCGDERLTEDEAVNAVVYCPDDNIVLYDDDFTREVHVDIGDFGMAVLFAHQWAVAFQSQSGVTADDLYTALQGSCFTGTWTASVWRGDRNTEESWLELSPGDLDEAIQAFLAFSEKPDERGNTEHGNAFQRVEAYRDGFVGSMRGGDLAGEQVCAQYTVEEASDGES